MTIFRFIAEQSPNGVWCFYSYCACHERAEKKNAKAFHVITGKNAEMRLIYKNIAVDRKTAFQHSVDILTGKTTEVDFTK